MRPMTPAYLKSTTGVQRTPRVARPRRRGARLLAPCERASRADVQGGFSSIMSIFTSARQTAMSWRRVVQYMSSSIDGETSVASVENAVINLNWQVQYIDVFLGRLSTQSHRKNLLFPSPAHTGLRTPCAHITSADCRIQLR